MKETAEGFGLLCIIGEQNIARSNLILKSGSLGNVVQGKTGSGVCGSCGQDDGCKSWVNKPQTGKGAARICDKAEYGKEIHHKQPAYQCADVVHIL